MSAPVDVRSIIRREIEWAGGDAYEAGRDLIAVDAAVAELIEAAKAMRDTHNTMLARWWQQHNYTDKVLGGMAEASAKQINAALARIGAA